MDDRFASPSIAAATVCAFVRNWLQFTHPRLRRITLRGLELSGLRGELLSLADNVTVTMRN